MSDASQVYVAVGRRKTSSARVRLSRGTGEIVINGRSLEAHFAAEAAQRIVLEPIKVAELEGQLNLVVRVQGGGVIGQAGAVRHGIARALEKMDSELRPALKKQGYMTRDPRMKERKKAGQPGARKRFQFSKR
jgi:small subunit ribosomal protein S9